MSCYLNLGFVASTFEVTLINLGFKVGPILARDAGTLHETGSKSVWGKKAFGGVTFLGN